MATGQLIGNGGAGGCVHVQTRRGFLDVLGRAAAGAIAGASSPEGRTRRFRDTWTVEHDQDLVRASCNAQAAAAAAICSPPAGCAGGSGFLVQ